MNLSIASTELYCWRRGHGEFKKERGQPCPRGDRSKLWETRGQGCPRSSGEILERTLPHGPDSISNCLTTGPSNGTIVPMRKSHRALGVALLLFSSLQTQFAH